MRRGFTLGRLLFAAICVLFGAGSLFAQPDTWVRTFGTSLSDTPEDILVDDAGNSYVSGYFRDTMQVQGQLLESAGLTDIFLLKYDPTGQLLWAKRLGWNANEFAHGLAFDLSGNILMVGEYQDSTIFEGDTLFSGDSLWYGAPAQTYDVFWVRFTPAGVMDGLWTGGWFGSEGWSEIEVGLDSLYYMAGFFRTFNNWTYVNEFDSAGHGRGYDECIWVRSTSSGTMDHKAMAKGRYVDKAKAIALVGDSVVVMAGTFEDTLWFEFPIPGANLITNFEEDIWIASYDDTAAFKWVVQGNSAGVDDLTALISNAQGEIYFSGQFEGDFSMGLDWVYGVNYLDGVVGKLDANGNVLWMKGFGGAGYDGVRDLRLLSNGNVLVTGYYQGSMDVGGTVLTASSPQDQNAYVILLDPSGNTIWARDLGGDDVDLGVAVDEDANGYIYAVGTYTGVGHFGQISDTAEGGEDIFLLRMNSDGAVFSQDSQDALQASVAAWPNPTRDIAHIGLQITHPSEVSIQILDLQGRTVQGMELPRQATGAHVYDMDLGGFAPGIYLYQVRVGSQMLGGKLSVVR